MRQAKKLIDEAPLIVCLIQFPNSVGEESWILYTPQTTGQRVPPISVGTIPGKPINQKCGLPNSTANFNILNHEPGKHVVGFQNPRKNHKAEPVATATRKHSLTNADFHRHCIGDK